MVASNFLYPKLRGKIIEKFQSYSNFANALNTYDSVVSRKLNGSLTITVRDIPVWAKLLDIEKKDWGDYFFEHIV